MELQLSANDSSCDGVIALPLRSHSEASTGTTFHGAVSRSDADSLRGTNTPADALPGTSAEDEYVLGGYAGI
jgi:hypothetical protein